MSSHFMNKLNDFTTLARLVQSYFSVANGQNSTSVVTLPLGLDLYPYRSLSNSLLLRLSIFSSSLYSSVWCQRKI